MLTDYVRAAMARARYEILPESGAYYGSIPGFQGVWADGPTLEACRAELQEVLEDWILLSLRRAEALPVVDGIDLNVRDVAWCCRLARQARETPSAPC